MNVELPRVYLVRHGETAWTLTAQHTGRTNLPLTDQGERQALDLRASLATLRVERIFSSPLQRVLRTAELEGRRLMLATESVSIVGYDHHYGHRYDLTEPVIHAWNAGSGDGGLR